jgi:hypothetical protein
MNAAVKSILKWGTFGALAAFLTVWWVSDGMPIAHRVTCGLMAAGGGLVTFALLAANFKADEETEEPGSLPH